MSDCFDTNGEIKPIQIAQEKAEAEGQDPMVLAQRLMDNLTRIRAIRGVDLPEQIVPSEADLDKAIDIFDRVNSQGTKLTDAELALTHVTGKWPEARRKLKAKIEDCANLGFDFSLTFMTRALTTAVTNRALFDTLHQRPRDELEKGWQTLVGILDYLLTILPQKAFINSTDDINTTKRFNPPRHVSLDERWNIRRGENNP